MSTSQTSRAGLAHARTAGPISAPASIVDHARSRRPAGSTPRSIACRCTAGTRSRSSSTTRAATAPSSRRNTGTRGKPCPLAVVNGEDPALFIAGFEYLPAGASEYDFAGAIKGAPIEVFAGPVTGLPLPAQRGDHPRRRAAAAEPGDAAGRPVRRVHRLLRRRQAALPGDGGDGDPPPQRSDPARLAADEAAALPFRPAVPRRRHLEQSRDGRRHRRRRRVAARRAADDRGGAQAALRRPRQARRADRGRQQLHGPARGRGRRRRRSVRTSPT